MNASDVLNRITQHKTSQEPLVDHLASVEPSLGLKVSDCASWLRIREWINGGETRLVNANFCKKFLLCQCCAARRAGKLVSAYAAKAEYLTECHPHLVPAVITLTIKNGSDLQERLEHLRTAWSAMLAQARKGKSLSSRNQAIEWNKVAGAVRAIEITRNRKTLEWHPHIHCFALLNRYIDHESLSNEWERFTGDSRIVDVRKCKNGIVPGMIETLKYVTKMSDLMPEESLQVHHAAAGSRFTDPFGCLRGIPEPDISTDDCAGLVGPYRDYIASWLWSRRSYRIRPADDSITITRPQGRSYGKAAASAVPSPVLEPSNA